MKNTLNILFTTLIFCVLYSCSKKEGCTDPLATNFNPDATENDGVCIYDEDKNPTPTPVQPEPGEPTPFPLQIPQIFAQFIGSPTIPQNNPQTLEGVALGRKLFFDPILSADGTLACASCHAPEFAFTDSNRYSTGITMQQGDRNAMAIFNAAWNNHPTGKNFFWDGEASSLEEQAFEPITNPIEMNNTWPNALASLQADAEYPSLFNAAFGTSTIDSTLVTKAIAQFERTLISGNTKVDLFILSQGSLTSQEIRGLDLFLNENGGDCFHCHGQLSEPLWTDNEFHNNGLDATFLDLGLGAITGDPADNGKFKTPSLRNLAYTAPYMHDGRFATLDEVIDHYSEGLVHSPTIDPKLKYIAQGGVNLTPSEKADLKAFLLALSEPGFTTNPNFQDPN